MFRIPTDGVNVYIGKPPHTQVMRVSQAALGAVPVLRERLSEGVTIINTDPAIFAIALQYIGHVGFMARLQPVLHGPLGNLVSGSNIMLKLAKAWHLAHMLELPRMQNKLIDTFSIYYRQSVYRGILIPLCKKPFKYLRDHMGSYTRCEKFLIDFHAGLTRNGRGYSSEELEQLPRDIARELEARRADMLVRHTASDRIRRGENCFYVSYTDDTRRVALQVLPPSLLRMPVNLPQARYGSSRSMSPMATTQTAATPRSAQYDRGHRSRLSLPTNLGRVGDGDRAVRTRPAPGRTSPLPRPASTSTRAPFMPYSPSQQRRLSRMHAEEESSDESDYDLPTLQDLERNDSSQPVDGSVQKES
jgi:hypothetical protein